MIYHLVPEAEFRAGLQGAVYRPGNLAGDGFVHCALRASVVPIANDFFAQVRGPLLLVEIDPDRLSAETRYESPAPVAGAGASHLSSASVFPHVYGPIELEAITRVGVLVTGVDGFEWPARFMELEPFLSRSQ